MQVAEKLSNQRGLFIADDVIHATRPKGARSKKDVGTPQTANLGSRADSELGPAHDVVDIRPAAYKEAVRFRGVNRGANWSKGCLCHSGGRKALRPERLVFIADLQSIITAPDRLR